VNAFYQHTSGSMVNNSSNTINTGLLPAALGIGAKTRQNDLDVAFQFSFFTGVDSTNGISTPANTGGYAGYGTQSALGVNSLNIRQAFMTVGDASWGQIKLGRDLGVFESDAILSDMTLLGVGTPAGVFNGSVAGGSTTLGRIGQGYLYADWKSQIQYQTPNWNGFQVTVAVDTPWDATGTAGVLSNKNKDMGFEGKATYDFAANDVTGRVWVGGISQKLNATSTESQAAANFTASGWDIGGKAAYQGAELVASYYSGEGIGIVGFLVDAANANGTKTKSDGYYVQGTYKLPTIGTKVGLSYGESNLDTTGGVTTTRSSWIGGLYHPLTKSVNLVAEYARTDLEVTNTATTHANTVSLGAIMFF